MIISEIRFPKIFETHYILIPSFGSKIFKSIKMCYKTQLIKRQGTDWNIYQSYFFRQFFQGKCRADKFTVVLWLFYLRKFISPSVLKDNYAGYSILGWWFWFSHTLSISRYALFLLVWFLKRRPT